MSVEQIEEQVRRLPPRDLARFVAWFDAFVGRTSSSQADEIDELTEEQKKELLRRRDELLANPSLAQPIDDDYFANLKRELANRSGVAQA